MDDLARLKTFIKVVEAGSFSAAARDESSTSAVARQVKSLEDELGVRLLNRSTRSLSLTEPGQLLYERACAIHHDLNNAKQAVRSFQETVKGLLRISVRVAFGTTVVVPALPSLLNQYPELSVDVTLTDERQDLVKDNIDVAVWMGRMPDSDNVAKRLCSTQRIICASPAYFARHGVPTSPTDLLDHNCLMFTAPDYKNVWTLSKDGEKQEIAVKGNVRSSNALVLLEAALDGLGLGVVHEWMVRRHIQEGRLMRVLREYTVNPTVGDADLYVVYPSNRGVSRKVRVFVDFLADLLRGPSDSLQLAAPLAAKTLEHLPTDLR